MWTRNRNVDGALRGVVAAIVVCCFIPAADAAEGTHLVTFDDLQSDTKSVEWQMEISPNGEILAYSTYKDEGDVLWLLNLRKGIPRSLGQGSMPRWSPDGTQLAFYSDRSGSRQLWIFNSKTEATAQVTKFEGGIDPDPVVRFSGWVGDPLRYSWSPDGTRIVFTSRTNMATAPVKQAVLSNAPEARGDGHQDQDNAKGRPIVLNNTSPPAWTFSGLFRSAGQEIGVAVASEKLPPPRTNQLFIVDVKSTTVTQLTKDDQGYFNPDWSVDGQRIAFASTEGRPLTGYGPDTSNIYFIDPSTGKKAALTEGPGQKRLPYWSSDGKWLAYLGSKQFERASVYVLPSTGGTPVNVTAKLDRAMPMFYWSSSSKSVFAAYQDGVSWPIAKIRVSDGSVQRITHDDGWHYPFAVSHKDDVVWVQSDGSSRGRLCEADSEGHDTRLLLDLNPQLREWVLGKQEVIRWKNSRSDDLEGILIKPVGYQEGKSYPLIVDPYPAGGIVNTFLADAMNGNQAFASRGYAVFFPQERTAHTWENPFKSEAFDKAARGPAGADIMMDDLMSGIDAVIRMGVADPNRMCLYGFSNGAGATNLIITRTARFKCAVSASAVGTDWSFSFFLQDPGTFANLIGGATPWDNPEPFLKLSPVYHLSKVTTPMLLAVGDEEESSVLMELEMYTGLRYLGRDVTFLRYPGQGHGFTGAALRDYWERINAFFDQYLKPQKPQG